jgi:hypothetical protein
MALQKPTINYIKHQQWVKDRFKNDTRKITPWHISLYHALFYAWNDNKFQNPFPIFRMEIMKISRIGSANTYTKCLKELDDFGYINYYPSHDPNQGSQVYLYSACNSTDKSSDNTTDKSSDKTSDKSSDNTTDKSSDKTTVRAVIPLNKGIKQVKEIKPIKPLKDWSKLKFASASTSQEVKNELKKGILNVSIQEKTQKESKSSGDGILPTGDEVKLFFKEQLANHLEAEKFFNHFESNGWLVGGKTKMKNWKAAARNWILNAPNFNAQKNTQGPRPLNLHVEQDKRYDIPL